MRSIPKHASSRPVVDLGPLQLHEGTECFCFTLIEPADISLELPSQYEQVLASELKKVLPSEPTGLFVDLENRVGINSRQLGALLALRKVLAPQIERLPLENVSEQVCRLLDITQIGRFFDYRKPADD